MTALLRRLLGRMPVGWLQLTHSPGRLAAALAGVAFANVLVFVQLGILGGLNSSITRSYELFQADIMISAADSDVMTEGSNVARQWLFQSLADPEVISGTTLFIGMLGWSQPEGETTSQVFGIDPTRPQFLAPEIARKIAPLQLQNTAIVDNQTRRLTPETAATIRPQTPTRIETAGTTLALVDTFTGGAGFGADGYMFASDQTFLGLFGKRQSGAPNHILLNVAPGADPDRVAERLLQVLPAEALKVRSLAQAAQDERVFQTTERPTGLIFGFGVIMGVLVGLIIVYQVLSTDVADHLAEYATFKAMGYGQPFFLGVIFEEATILAVLGFVPGFTISALIYQFLTIQTGLPIAMQAATAVMVFLGTLAACSLSGALATRRLARADPADLF